MLPVDAATWWEIWPKHENSEVGHFHALVSESSNLHLCFLLACLSVVSAFEHAYRSTHDFDFRVNTWEIQKETSEAKCYGESKLWNLLEKPHCISIDVQNILGFWDVITGAALQTTCFTQKFQCCIYVYLSDLILITILQSIMLISYYKPLIYSGCFYHITFFLEIVLQDAKQSKIKTNNCIYLRHKLMTCFQPLKAKTSPYWLMHVVVWISQWLKEISLYIYCHTNE